MSFYNWSAHTKKPVKQRLVTGLRYLSCLIVLILSKTPKVYILTQLVMSKVKVNSWLYIRCVQVLKWQLTNSTKHASVIKGMVHPKWKFCHYLLTLTLSQTCINFFLVLNKKEDILKNVGNQTVAGPIVFNSKKKKKSKYYGSQRGPATVWLPTFFKITFMFNRRKKVIQV